ncbi:hypothetical protein ACHAXS_005647 [Conticribra weissflogii]
MDAEEESRVNKTVEEDGIVEDPELDGFRQWFFDEKSDQVADIVNDSYYIHINDDDFLPSSFSLEKWREIGSVLSRCKKLGLIWFSSQPLEEEMLMALFQADGPYDFPLRGLFLDGNRFFGPRGMQAILPFLNTRTELEVLKLGSCELGNDGARYLAKVLDHVRIKELLVGNNSLDTEGISLILSSENAMYLEHLDISGRNLGLAECALISQFLSREGICLEHISVGENGRPDEDADFDDDLDTFDIEWVIMLIRSLRGNKSLKRIDVYSDTMEEQGTDEEIDEIWDDVADATMSLVCNTTSIQACCQSNHVLNHISLFSEERFPQRIEEVLGINERDISTNKKVRRKLQNFFFDGMFEVHPFLSMKTVCMPHVLALFANERLISIDELDDTSCEGSIEGNLNGLYNFMRHWNLPALYTSGLQQVGIEELQGQNGDLLRMVMEAEEKLSCLEELGVDDVMRSNDSVGQ